MIHRAVIVVVPRHRDDIDIRPRVVIKSNGLSVLANVSTVLTQRVADSLKNLRRGFVFHVLAPMKYDHDI